MNATNNDNKEKITARDALSYDFQFFQLMSSQRISMINFYITIIVVLVGALSAGLINQVHMWIKISVFLIIIVVSIAFWGLDIRNKTAIKEITKAMEMCENHFIFPELGVLHNSNKQRVFLNSYSFWIRMVYLLAIIEGVSGIVLCVLGLI